MRYDSDPYVVKKIIKEAEMLNNFLNNPHIEDIVLTDLFTELEPFTKTFFGTLDHLANLHVLNPQFSLSRFSAHSIKENLYQMMANITDIFSLKRFPSLEDQAIWNKRRFIFPDMAQDSEQTLVSLYTKVAQVLHTYYTENVRKRHFAVLLNEVVGWAEHIEMHGHHDMHSVILFSEKIARDSGVIEHRVEVVREICTVLKERAFLKQTDTMTIQTSQNAALQLSRIYSPYLLELYKALLEDIEIIAIAEKDYQVFEQYCFEHQIDVYEEYHDILKERLKRYVMGIAPVVPPAFRLIKTANLIICAESTCERYQEAETIVDVLGLNLKEDMRLLQQAIEQLDKQYPELSLKWDLTLKKIKRLRREIVKPAIQIYSQYIKEPQKFFEQLPSHQAEWIPVLEGAMACLELDDDLYWKCHDLKEKIDRAGLKNDNFPSQESDLLKNNLI